MTYLHAAVLGLVQGLAEFLPVSSSGHLALIPWLMRWPDQGLDYDVALHWGTLAALAACYWRDWKTLLLSAARRRPGPESRLFWGLVLATLPAVLCGLLLEKTVEEHFRRPDRVAWALAAFGLLLGWSDSRGSKSKGLSSLSTRDFLMVGAAQALALAPGVSRSGITLTAALLRGARREEAARLSFLMAAPITLGAGVLKLRHLGPEALTGPFWVGIAVSALSGAAAVSFFLAYIRRRDIWVFVWYRVALAGLCLMFYHAKPGPMDAFGLNVSRPAPPQSGLSPEAARLQADVRALASDIGERDAYHPERLLRARDHVVLRLRESGYVPELLEYRSRGLAGVPDGRAFHNVEAVVRPAAGRPPRGAWVLGAHYDSAPGTPGADDNASGVAALLEIARELRDRPPPREVRLVFFSTEEPPSFGGPNMGSAHYARELKSRGTALQGMISLEMVGYYNTLPGSQTYPPFLHLFFPDRGDFIGLAGNFPSRRFLGAVKRGWARDPAVPLVTASLPEIEALTLSDHANFWAQGVPALILTDTANYRNPNYHMPTDTPELLDYERMASVARSLAAAARRAD